MALPAAAPCCGDPAAQQDPVSDYEDFCYICFGTASTPENPLQHVCRCPTQVHLRCMARWSLYCAGKPEERECRFCKGTLPDWKSVLTPKHLPPAVPVLSIYYQSQVVRMRVQPGPGGLQAFLRQLEAIVGRDVNNVNFVFRCRCPDTGAEIFLKGLPAFEAAMHCACVRAAQRMLQQQQQLLQEQEQQKQQHLRRLSACTPPAPSSEPLPQQQQSKAGSASPSTTASHREACIVATAVQAQSALQAEAAPAPSTSLGCSELGFTHGPSSGACHGNASHPRAPVVPRQRIVPHNHSLDADAHHSPSLDQLPPQQERSWSSGGVDDRSVLVPERIFARSATFPSASSPLSLDGFRAAGGVTTSPAAVSVVTEVTEATATGAGALHGQPSPLLEEQRQQQQQQLLQHASQSGSHTSASAAAGSSSSSATVSAASAVAQLSTAGVGLLRRAAGQAGTSAGAGADADAAGSTSGIGIVANGLAGPLRAFKSLAWKSLWQRFVHSP